MVAAALIIDFVHHYEAEIVEHRFYVYSSLLLFAASIICMVDNMAVYHLDTWFWVRQWASLLILGVVSVEYNYVLTRTRKRERAIWFEAHHDGMTGLRNFTSFTEDLKEIHEDYLETGNRYTLLEFDTDHFKRVNDSYGHPDGNIVLRAVAKTTHDFAESLDFRAHAYRLGGEEFAIILNADLSVADEAVLSRELRLRIRELRFKGDLAPLRLSISIGVAPVNSHDTNYLSVYTAADSYLYQIKQDGRNGAAVRGQVIH